MNKNKQAKYIKYLHLNLLQNVIISAPTIPRTDRPMIAPKRAVTPIVT